jgi:hypothetical protein
LPLEPRFWRWCCSRTIPNGCRCIWLGFGFAPARLSRDLSYCLNNSASLEFGDCSWSATAIHLSTPGLLSMVFLLTTYELVVCTFAAAVFQIVLPELKVALWFGQQPARRRQAA